MAPYNGRVLDAESDGPPSANGRRDDVPPSASAEHERLLALTLSRPAEALAEAGRLLAQDPDARTASVAHQARGIVLRDTGRVTEAISELRAALRLATTLGTAERACDVQATLGVTLALAGRTAAGLAALDRAASASTGVLAGRVLARRGGLLGLLGRHSEALADLRRAITLLHRGGDKVWEARSRSHRFLVYAARGQVARADRDLAIAGAVSSPPPGRNWSLSILYTTAPMSRSWRGDLPAALRLLDEADAGYSALSVFSRNLALDRCTVLLAAGLATEALAETDEAIARHRRDGGQATRMAELLFAAARAGQAAGEPSIAVARATAARELFRAQHRHWWHARASFVLLQSRYANGERGVHLRIQTARIANDLGALGAEETPTAHLLAGRLAAEQGRTQDADRHFSSAARFRHRGPTFARAAGWLAHALRAEARGTPRASFDRLSTRSGRGRGAPTHARCRRASRPRDRVRHGARRHRTTACGAARRRADAAAVDRTLAGERVRRPVRPAAR